MTSAPDAVLNFWFGRRIESTKQYCEERIRLWFEDAAETDRYLRRHFGEVIEAAAEGKLASWAVDSRGCLALILLLDQFSMKAYRDSGKALETSNMAAQVAVEAIDRRLDRSLHALARMFFYLPLDHSEEPSFKRRALFLFTGLTAQAVNTELRGCIECARRYTSERYAEIRCQGRAPDREALVGHAGAGEKPLQRA